MQSIAERGHLVKLTDGQPVNQAIGEREGPGRSHLTCEPVANGVDVEDVARTPGGVTNLGAQIRNAHSEILYITCDGLSPDVACQFLPGHDALAISEEIFQYAPFHWRQHDRLAAHPELARLESDLKQTLLILRRRRIRTGAPQVRPNPRSQFVVVKGLGHLIIRAIFQPVHQIPFLVHRC